MILPNSLDSRMSPPGCNDARTSLFWPRARLARVTGERNLVYSGGVALNCVSNFRLERDGPFDALFISGAAMMPARRSVRPLPLRTETARLAMTEYV